MCTRMGVIPKNIHKCVILFYLLAIIPVVNLSNDIRLRVFREASFLFAIIINPSRLLSKSLALFGQEFSTDCDPGTRIRTKKQPEHHCCGVWGKGWRCESVLCVYACDIWHQGRIPALAKYKTQRIHWTGSTSILKVPLAFQKNIFF